MKRTPYVEFVNRDSEGYKFIVLILVRHLNKAQKQSCSGF